VASRLTYRLHEVGLRCALGGRFLDLGTLFGRKILCFLNGDDASEVSDSNVGSLSDRFISVTENSDSHCRLWPNS